MPAHRSTDGDLDHAPVYIRAGIGADDNWKVRAPCRGRGEEMHNIWCLDDQARVEFGDTVYTGAELTAAALEWCRACPVQWDCARFGIITLASAGTYGMHIDDLKALRKRNWRGLIGAAEEAGTPVQLIMRNGRVAPTC